jgi:hypothetical protein
MTDTVCCSHWRWSCRKEIAGLTPARASLDRQTKAPLRAMFFVTSLCAVAWSMAPAAFAQSVGLPAPRLLTTMPMGGTAGSQIEITISGENLEDADELAFSNARITATPKLDAAGLPEPNKYIVTIAADCPVGLYEARMMTRLGISSSRAFSVGSLLEVVRTKPNTSLETAMELQLDSLCNASTSPRAVDHYSFTGRKGQRVIVECAAKGIDSKLNAVLILGDAEGRDLLVERQGGVLDFTVPEDDKYVIKVHDLTYSGGASHFYRLALRELSAGTSMTQHPSTRTVSSFSWPPQGQRDEAETAEIEPNNDRSHAQKISLPCDISGSFFPAADVDVFDFEARKGDVWWVEVASERFGLPTDPAIVVQHVSGSGDAEKLTDVAELSDIPSPVKVSSNGYAYDGPPYNAGSSDILAKLPIQQDGVHRLQLTDLFGGTRKDPRNVYRLVIRKEAPDFALVAWALHMELRNGDRNALSKPMALRGGSTMALEVVAVRRDGFDGEIELAIDGLPEGMTARGLKIPPGQSRGIMLVTASQDAPRSRCSVTFTGRAQIDGAAVTRPVRLASMAWPVADAWQEIPSPRLLADVPVSVSGFESAPLSIAPSTSEVLEVTAGEKLTVPLVQTRRSDFSGTTMTLKTFGVGFEHVPPFDVPLTADASQAVLDLAALKTLPGDYLISFYGSAVAKYRDHPEAVLTAETAHRKAEQELMALEAEAKAAAEQVKTVAAEGQAEAAKAAEELAAKRKAAAAAVAEAATQLKKAIEAVQPKDIVDIVVSEPIAIRVKPAEKK